MPTKLLGTAQAMQHRLGMGCELCWGTSPVLASAIIPGHAGPGSMGLLMGVVSASSQPLTRWYLRQASPSQLSSPAATRGHYSYI